MNDTIVIRYLASIWVEMDLETKDVDNIIDTLKEDDRNVFTYMNDAINMEYLYETEMVQEPSKGMPTVKVLKNNKAIWTNYDE